MCQCFFRATTRAAPPPTALTRNRPLTTVPRREPWSPVCGSPEGSELDGPPSIPVGEEVVSDAEGEVPVPAETTPLTSVDVVAVVDDADCVGTTAGVVVDGAADSVPVAVGVAEVGTPLVAVLDTVEDELAVVGLVGDEDVTEDDGEDDVDELLGDGVVSEAEGDEDVVGDDGVTGGVY